MYILNYKIVHKKLYKKFNFIKKCNNEMHLSFEKNLKILVYKPIFKYK